MEVEGGENMKNYGKHFEEAKKPIDEPVEKLKRPVFVEVKSGYNLNVRKTNDPQSDVIDIMSRGNRARLLVADEPMSKIMTSDKKIGFVLSEFLEEVSND